MAISGFGVWSLVIGLLSFHVFHTLFTLFYTRWMPQLIFSGMRLREMFRFAGPLVGTNLVWYTTHNIDSILIGKLLGTDLLGYYRVAMDLSRIPINRFIKIIHEVCFPVFSKLQNDLEGLRSYFLKVVKYVSLGSFPLFVGMILLAEEIIYLILTPKWMPALNLLIIFSILGIIQSLLGIFSILLKARGKVGIIFKWSLALGILLPLFFLIMIPFGLTAVAFSWLIVYPALFI
jgi:O-antigen/teichoic acid export membrane protein